MIPVGVGGIVSALAGLGPLYVRDEVKRGVDGLVSSLECSGIEGAVISVR